MKKKFSIALLVGTILFIGIETTLYFMNKPKYKLNLPSAENVKYINIENKKIEEPEKIKEIIESLNKESRTTKKTSIHDAPVNAEEIIKIDFSFTEGTSRIFLYKRNNNFYIEQPYNGIYEITESEYNKIKYFTLEE